MIKKEASRLYTPAYHMTHAKQLLILSSSSLPTTSCDSAASKAASTARPAYPSLTNLAWASLQVPSPSY